MLRHQHQTIYGELGNIELQEHAVDSHIYLIPPTIMYVSPQYASPPLAMFPSD